MSVRRVRQPTGGESMSPATPIGAAAVGRRSRSGVDTGRGEAARGARPDSRPLPPCGRRFLVYLLEAQPPRYAHRRHHRRNHRHRHRHRRGGWVLFHYVSDCRSTATRRSANGQPPGTHRDRWEPTRDSRGPIRDSGDWGGTRMVAESKAGTL